MTSDVPELFCKINEGNDSLGCQYKDKRDSAKTFGDEDIISFVDRATSGAYITIRSKRGFERTFEVDPASTPFKRLKDNAGHVGVSELAKDKLDIYQAIERKAIQISDGLDTVYLQSDVLKYDPAIATDKCKIDMKTSTSGEKYEKNIENLDSENKSLSIYLTSLLKAFKEAGSCLSDFPIAVAADGTVELSQLQGLPRAFRNRCKKKL